MDNRTLYDFIYSLLKSYEDSKDRTELTEGCSRALSLFFPMCKVKIYFVDEFSYLLKDFTKPWETLNNQEIQAYFDNFLIKKSTYVIKDNLFYFPITQKNKIIGIVEIEAREKIAQNITFIDALPLIALQISMIISTLKNKEQIKITSKFHQTLKNIAQTYPNPI